jgi:hypothetical protein
VTPTIGQFVVVKMSHGTKLAIVLPPHPRVDVAHLSLWNESARRWTKTQHIDVTRIIATEPKDARQRRAEENMPALVGVLHVGLFRWVMEARYPQAALPYNGPAMVVAPPVRTLLRLDGGVWEVASPIDGHHRLDLVGYDERPTMYLRNGRTIRAHVSTLAGAVEINDA